MRYYLHILSGLAVLPGFLGCIALVLWNKERAADRMLMGAIASFVLYLLTSH